MTTRATPFKSRRLPRVGDQIIDLMFEDLSVIVTRIEFNDQHHQIVYVSEDGGKHEYGRAARYFAWGRPK